ncbi:unnamed protein product [Gadus morhua 'NCC']
MQGNGFTCNCDNAWFLQWVITNEQTQVFAAYNYECSYPPNLKAVSFTHHFLQWHLVYAYYLMLAFLYNSKNKDKRAHQYDAFVSYNANDEGWVLGELLPKLEEE